MKKMAKLLSKNSRSNGCLMRIAPLAVWLSGLVEETTEESKLKLYKRVIISDVEMTHPDPLA